MQCPDRQFRHPPPHEPRSVVFGLSGRRSKGILQRESVHTGPRWVSLPIGRRKAEHDKVLQVHHKVYRSQGGTDTPEILSQYAEDATRICMPECFELKARKKQNETRDGDGDRESVLKTLEALKRRMAMRRSTSENSVWACRRATPTMRWRSAARKERR